MEELLNDAGHRVEQWLKLSEHTFEFASTARARFAEGDIKTKKEILATIGSNLILKDKKLSIEAKKPFFILENSRSGYECENIEIEPENIRLPQRQKEANASLSPTLGGKRDDVRTLYHKNAKDVREVYDFWQNFKGTPSDIFPGQSADGESIDHSRN